MRSFLALCPPVSSLQRGLHTTQFELVHCILAAGVPCEWWMGMAMIWIAATYPSLKSESEIMLPLCRSACVWCVYVMCMLPLEA